ncbi:MAG TPA: radical SAM protein [Myxococcales bacterium]
MGGNSEHCACQPGLGAKPGTARRIVRLADLLVPRFLARLSLWFLLLSARPLITAERVQRFWRRRFLCETSQGPVGTHGAFLRSFHDAVLASGSFERLVGYLQGAPGWEVACRLEGFGRSWLLASLRHRLLEGNGGPPPLTEVHLACCVECDQACHGCYSACDRGGTTPDAGRLGQLFDEAATSGAAVVHLIGKGEPFLDDARGLALLGAIRAHRELYFTLATSALHLSPALCEAAAATPNVLLLVSIDGRQAQHDERRGTGTWERVVQAMFRLRESRAFFAFSCTVASTNWREVVSAEFLRSMRQAGCTLGVYSRYFSVQPSPEDRWPVPAAVMGEYREKLASARRTAEMPLIDLDELEAFTGCRARAGLSVYVDGTSGRVLPCIRLPWAPEACRLSEAPRGELDRVLRHSFFQEFRKGSCSSGCWCGADLPAEQQAVRSRAQRFDRT